MPDVPITAAELADWQRRFCAPAIYGTWEEWIADVRPLLRRLIAEVQRLRKLIDEKETPHA